MPTEGRSKRKTGYHAAMERGGEPVFAMPPEGYVPHPELAAPVVQQPVADPMRQAFEAAPMGKELMEAVVEEPIDPRIQEVYSDPSTQEESPIEDVLDSLNEEVSSEPAQSSPSSKKTTQDNFRNLRIENDRIARENERIARENNEMRLKMLELQMSPKPQPVEEERFVFQGEDDSFVETSQLKKVAEQVWKLEKKLQQQERELQQEKQKNEVSNLHIQLRSEYSDFDTVFNSKTIEDFKTKHPRLAASLGSITDKYERSVAGYEMMKQLGMGDQPMANNYVDKAKAVVNNSKPRPLTSIAPN